MLFLISLLIGLILGCLIGGVVLLMARSMTPSHPVVDAPVRRAQQPVSAHGI